jgi:hypothetical protein
VLRYNGAASSVILLPVDLPIRSWPVAIVTLKGRTINPVVQTFVDCVRDVSKPLAIQNLVAAATKGEVVVTTHSANHNGPMTRADRVAEELGRLEGVGKAEGGRIAWRVKTPSDPATRRGRTETNCSPLPWPPVQPLPVAAYRFLPT